MRTILPSHRLNKASVDRHYIGHRRDGSTRPGSICIPKAMPDVDLASSLAAGFSGLVHSHGIALAYEPVALPCSMMRCGDVVHRRYAWFSVPVILHRMDTLCTHPHDLNMQLTRFGATGRGDGAGLEGHCITGHCGDLSLPTSRHVVLRGPPCLPVLCLHAAEI